MLRPDPDRVALAFDNAGVVRGGRPLWSEATFEVPSGGVVAVVGANGAGKSTLLQVILGLIPLSSGHVRVFGKRPGEDNQSIGYLPQNYALRSDHAIRAADAVLLGLNGYRWAFARTTAGQRRRVEEALQSMHATEFAGKRLSQLSGGQRQRVAIAEALVARPKLLMLDEPLASLDLRSQREIVELLQRLHQDRDVTILVVAHDLNPVLNLLDSAIYLLDGQARYDTIDSVLTDALLSRIYGTPVEVASCAHNELYIRNVV
ncbi:metal ABC transporter ATP-binding protein [Mycobacterium sp.]|uniref:metal ABC transporter ATP-binding protein n=1 Tax=Mycobacterium sp. TaxID=1785 RepID=UPI003C70754F